MKKLRLTLIKEVNNKILLVEKEIDFRVLNVFIDERKEILINILDELDAELNTNLCKY